MDAITIREAPERRPGTPGRERLTGWRPTPEDVERGGPRRRSRRRVLVLTKFQTTEGLPSGGMIRTQALVGALRTRYDVRVLGYHERGRHRPRSRPGAALGALATGRAYQVARYDTRWLRRQLTEALRDFRPDAIHVDYSPLAPLAMGLALPRLLDMHNVESVFAAGVAATTRGPASLLARRDARLMRELEERSAEDYDVVIVNSRAEAERAPGEPEVVPNGVHPGRQPLPDAPDQDVATFVGLFSWLPNIDAAEWLVGEVLPLLPSHMRLRLVGRNPDARVRALAGPRVEVTGTVPDTWPHVCRAGVLLAPMRSTGGTRHKILEGLLAGRPVVATRVGAEGLEDLVGRGLVLADSAEDLARAIADLAADPGRAAALGAAGRRAVIERYDWGLIGRRLLELYERRLGVA